MERGALHRRIEQHAVARGSVAAVIDGERAVSYKELNYAANSVARHLIAAGLRRGAQAEVRMSRGIDLAIVLLAIVKAGGCYTWKDPERDVSGEAPGGVAFACGTTAGEDRWRHVDLHGVLTAPIVYSPNLPIVARSCDIACVLRDGDSQPVLVPHGTITALQAQAMPHPTPWVGDAGAFDLWMALMAGTTAVVDAQAPATAAA